MSTLGPQAKLELGKAADKSQSQQPAVQGGSFDGLQHRLLLPAWLVIGFFLLLPVLLMLVYSFLTKEFRGGVIWEFSLAAYDQFFVDRGLFGDEPIKIEWTYLNIFWRSVVQATLATVFCLLVGFPTAYFIATRAPQVRHIWLFLITIPYWVCLLIRTVSMKFLIRDNGPMNEFLLSLGLIDQPIHLINTNTACLLYTSPSPRDATLSRMPSSA